MHKFKHYDTVKDINGKFYTVQPSEQYPVDLEEDDVVVTLNTGNTLDESGNINLVSILHLKEYQLELVKRRLKD